jgi:L-lactate dehydrogenase
MKKKINKVTVVGTGFVGATTAYTLMISGLISELVLIDANVDKAEGEAMDLNHGMPFVAPVNVYHGEYKDCVDSDIIIISAGANQKPGETRIDLVKKNTAIFKQIIPELVKYSKDSILLVVTNPVDILTYVTWKLSDFPKNRVIGSGTVLDTARFRYILAKKSEVDARNIHAYVLGEHGDTEVLTWSLTNIAGIPFDKFCDKTGKCQASFDKDAIFNDVRSAAYKIIEKKGATYYAVAVAVRRIVEAFLRDESSILTVSSALDGQYGLSDVSLSVPTLVGGHGVKQVLELPISDEELHLLQKSGNSLKEVIKTLDI